MSRVGLSKIVGRLRRVTAGRPDDGELLERFVAHRDEAAFAELVARHGPRVFAVCCRVIGNHHLAEDAFQAVFVVLARRARSIHPRSAVGGFLYGVARRTALEALAVSRRRKETLGGRVPNSPAPAASGADADVLAMLDEEIANLSETYRAAVVLCELDGVSRADAARQLGIAEGTLSSRLAAARKQLAARLRTRGVTLSGALIAALAASTATAVPPALMTTTGSVSTIAQGVLRAMMLSKLKLVALSVVLIAALLSARGPAPTDALRAAPVPKAAAGADPGVIWVYSPTFVPDGKIRATLTPYTPDGRKGEAIPIRDGFCFMGLTPDGRKIAFMGKGGKLANSTNAKGLTVHLRDIGDSTEGTDTGVPIIPIPVEKGHLGRYSLHPVWSPDMKQIVYSRHATADSGTKFRYYRRELATGKETPLDELGDDRVVTSWSRDGNWLLVNQNRQPFGGIWSRYSLADGKLNTITERPFLLYADLSPDGKTMIGFAEFQQEVAGIPRITWEMTRFDAATGEMTRADKFAFPPTGLLVMSRWSPDGRRVLHAVRERDGPAGEESVSIVVCDPDGGKEAKIMASRGQFLGWIYWLPTRTTALQPK